MCKLNCLRLVIDQFPKTFSSMSHFVTVVCLFICPPSSSVNTAIFISSHEAAETSTTHEINTRTFYPAAPCKVTNMGVFNIISASAQRTKSCSVGKRVQHLRSESLWPPGDGVFMRIKPVAKRKRFSWIWDLLRLEGPLMLLVARWQRNIKSVFTCTVRPETPVRGRTSQLH